MKTYNYDEAVKYLESKGIGCDPCQDEDGEWACDLLDELYSDPSDDNERYKELFIDAIANIILTDRQCRTGEGN